MTEVQDYVLQYVTDKLSVFDPKDVSQNEKPPGSILEHPDWVRKRISMYIEKHMKSIYESRAICFVYDFMNGCVNSFRDHNRVEDYSGVDVIGEQWLQEMHQKKPHQMSELMYGLNRPSLWSESNRSDCQESFAGVYTQAALMLVGLDRYFGFNVWPELYEKLQPVCVTYDWFLQAYGFDKLFYSKESIRVRENCRQYSSYLWSTFGMKDLFDCYVDFQFLCFGRQVFPCYAFYRSKMDYQAELRTNAVKSLFPYKYVFTQIYQYFYWYLEQWGVMEKGFLDLLMDRSQ